MTAPARPRLLVVVPAWNEETVLPLVLDELAATVHDADVLVVNDGSTDGTAAVVRAHPRAMLLDLPLNLGVGGAMRAGFRFAQRHGYDRVVQLDADGQHNPADIARVVALLDEGADVAIGARFAGEGDYRARGPRRWAMALLSTVLSRTAATRLTDTTSGFRAANARAIALFARDYPAEYLGDTVESLVIACRAGLRIRQTPVTMRARAGGAPSHGPGKAAIFLGRAVLALGVALSRPMAPPPPAPRPTGAAA
ncbi:glycosyltransferase family 2 protein [Cellulomonas sp. S1-8]|uniref:glycosyltransferase family 2 protein n=1 Tax=Cellulomonas sp. S1-8 TaxID=2904790 RepID=UPI0022430421|nr:glycosyltransferase family 2 protein [Cellulomonas sp. S1-8]UZN01904.1 glycosyltransferase family 2 protein [Cellulomonas sp. S1-8]